MDGRTLGAERKGVGGEGLGLGVAGQAPVRTAGTKSEASGLRRGVLVARARSAPGEGRLGRSGRGGSDGSQSVDEEQLDESSNSNDDSDPDRTWNQYQSTRAF